MKKIKNFFKNIFKTKNTKKNKELKRPEVPVVVTKRNKIGSPRR